MSKHHLFPTLAGVLIMTFLLTGCQKPKEPDTQEQPESRSASNLIRLSPEALRNAHFQTVVVVKRNVQRVITTTGEIKANDNRIFHVSSFVAGRVAQDRVSLGSVVRAGQVLAVIQNLDAAKVQANYIHELHQNEMDVREAHLKSIQANRTYAREKELFNEGISPKKDFLQAQTDAELAFSSLEGQKEHAVHIKSEAKALLAAYGMRPQADHAESIPTGSPLIAPRAGIVTKKTITLGDMVTPDTVLYEVADFSQVWLDLALYSKDLASVHTGLPVMFKSDSLPGQSFTGTINYVQPMASESSTFMARVFLTNPAGQLKPGMAGQATISEPDTVQKAFLPESSVQKFGKETFAFLDLGDGAYRKVTIQLGEPVSGGYLVNEGIQVGDHVVGGGSFTLKAELLKSQFGDND